MQDVGASAIELNIYYLPGDPSTPGREVEQRYVDVLQRVKDAVTVPVAVKLHGRLTRIGARTTAIVSWERVNREKEDEDGWQCLSRHRVGWCQ